MGEVVAGPISDKHLKSAIEKLVQVKVIQPVIQRFRFRKLTNLSSLDRCVGWWARQDLNLGPTDYEFCEEQSQRFTMDGDY